MVNETSPVVQSWALTNLVFVPTENGALVGFFAVLEHRTLPGHVSQPLVYQSGSGSLVVLVFFLIVSWILVNLMVGLQACGSCDWVFAGQWSAVGLLAPVVQTQSLKDIIPGLILAGAGNSASWTALTISEPGC